MGRLTGQLLGWLSEWLSLHAVFDDGGRVGPLDAFEFPAVVVHPPETLP